MKRYIYQNSNRNDCYKQKIPYQGIYRPGAQNMISLELLQKVWPIHNVRGFSGLVGKISHGSGGGGAPSIMFNLRKLDLISLFLFFFAI